MVDIFFVALSVGLFALGVGYVRGLQRLDEEAVDE